MWHWVPAYALFLSPLCNKRKSDSINKKAKWKHRSDKKDTSWDLKNSTSRISTILSPFLHALELLLNIFVFPISPTERQIHPTSLTTSQSTSVATTISRNTRRIQWREVADHPLLREWIPNIKGKFMTQNGNYNLTCIFPQHADVHPVASILQCILTPRFCLDPMHP